MNRFRKLGFIEYNGRIRVNKSLLNVILHDQPFEQNAVGASLFGKDSNGTNVKSGVVSKVAVRKLKMPA